MAIITDDRGRLYCSLSRNSADTMYQVIEKELKYAEKKLAYYQDVLESGNANDRQQNKVIEYEELVDELTSIIDCFDELLNK